MSEKDSKSGSSNENFTPDLSLPAAEKNLLELDKVCDCGCHTAWVMFDYVPQEPHCDCPLKTIIAPVGSASPLDPLDQYGSIGWKARVKDESTT